MRENLNSLMSTPMTRKQFLMTLGLAVASIFGIGHIIKLVFGDHRTVAHQLGTLNERADAYGHKS
jgi:hypothetical protein